MNKNTSKTPEVIFLEGDKIIFRPITEKDLDLIVRWVNNPQIRKYLTIYLPMTMEVEKKWLENMYGNEGNIVFAVIDKDSKNHIGNAGLHSINRRNSTATFGFMIGEEKYWGNGYGTSILNLILIYAFNTLGLRKVKSSILAPNIGSVKVHEKCGFTKIGTHKKEYLVDGEYVDEIILEILREDWIKIKK